MKSFLTFSRIVALSALVLASVACAQTSTAPQPRIQMSAVELRERRLKQLDERLQLTEEQKVKIRAIWDASETQVRAIQASSGDKPKRLRDLAAQTREHIRVILTPVQQKVFDTLPVDQPQPRRALSPKKK